MDDSKPKEKRTKRPVHPIDNGWAWVVFVASLVAMCLNGGMYRIFGILFVEFRERFSADATQITLIQAVHSAVYSFSMVLTLTFGLKILTCRQCMIISGILCTLSFILSSRAESIYFLVFSYGVLYGISMAVCVASIVVLLSRYFHKHTGLVNGCVQAASSFGTLVLSPTMRYLIDKYDVSGGLLVVSAILAHVVLAACLMRPPELYREWRRLKEKAAKRRAANRVPLLQNESLGSFRPRSPTSDSTYSTVARQAMLQRMRSRTDEMEDGCLKKAKSEESIPQVPADTKQQKVPAKDTWSVNEIHRNKMQLLYASNEFIVAVSDENLDKATGKQRKISRSSQQSDKSNVSTNQESKECGKNYLKSLFNCAVLKNMHFLLFVTAYFFGCNGGFLPTLYIPDLANDRGISKQHSAMLVSLIMAFDVIGRSTMGFISDRKFVDRRTLIIISMFITGALQHLLIFFTELWSLIIFSIVYGIFGGTIIALYAPVVLDTLPLKDLKSGLVILQIGQGISWAVANPVSGILRDATGGYSATFHFFGTASLLSCLILIISKCLNSKHKAGDQEIQIEELPK